MHRARAVGLHAALRAAHRRRGFRHVELLPVTQQERFALTRRQPAPAPARSVREPAAARAVGGVCRRVGVRFCRKRLERVVIIVFVVPSPRAPRAARSTSIGPSGAGNGRGSCSAGCAGTASGSSSAGLSAYFSVSLSIASWTMSSADVLVADGEHRLLERAALDLGEERREFEEVWPAEGRRGRRPTAARIIGASVSRRGCCGAANA